MTSKWKWIGLLLMGMVVAGFVGSLLARGSDRFLTRIGEDPAPPTATLTPTVTLTPTATLIPTFTPTVTATSTPVSASLATVTAQQLLQDFLDNEIRGDQPHKDKVKSVAGLVRDIRDDGLGYYIELGYAGDEWELGQVRCQLRNPEEAVALSEGQSLTVQGRIAGLDLLDIVVIEDCTVAAGEVAPLDEGLATPVPALIPSTAAPLRSTVQVEFANLRAGPSTDYDVVGSARRGETVEPMARNATGDWLHLRDGAWIYASLVDRVPENLPVADATQTEPAATVEPVWMTRYKRYQDMSAEDFWDEYLRFAPQEDDRGQCGFSMILAAAEAAGLQDTPAYPVVRQLGEQEVGDVDAAWYMNHCDRTSPSGREFYQAYTIYSIVLLEADVDNSGLRDDRLFMLAVRIGDLLEAAPGNPDLRRYYENMAQHAWCLFSDC